MKITLVFFSLIFANLLFAQEKAIKISSSTSEKEVIIKENKRIKIKTVDGQKISGRFHIDHNKAIVIKDQRIALSDIESLKRNPLFLSIFGSGFLIYGGALTVGMGAIIGMFVEASGFLLAIPGAAMIYAGIKSPNILKNYSADGNWEFELITLTQPTPQ